MTAEQHKQFTEGQQAGIDALGKTNPQHHRRSNMKQDMDVLVTPEMAAEFLDRNTRNRPIRQFKLQALMNDMKNGRWRFNGDAIRFYADGSLADGQHRCEAAVRTNTSFRANIIHGLTAEDGMTLDTGSTRTNADVLTLQGDLAKKDANHLAGAARVIIAHDAGSTNYPLPGGSYTKLTTSQQVFDWYVENIDVISEAIEWLNSYAPARARVLSGAYIIAFRILSSRIDSEASHIFLKKVVSGYGVQEGTTEAHCREILLSAIATPRKMTPRVRFLTAAKAFRSVVAGRGIKHRTNVAFRDGVDSVPTFPGFGSIK